MLLGMVGNNKAVIRIIDIMRGAALTQAELSLTQRRVSMQQSYYDRMVSQWEEVRRARHDIKHHRAAISALIKDGNVEALSRYIRSADEFDEALPITGNPAVDSVLLYYMNAAKALCVQMETNLSIGRKTPLSDPDLCVILGNLLENAIEAQQYLSTDDWYIRVTANGDEKNLTLAVDNRFDGTLNIENGAYISRKGGEEHGLGISSVKTICEKYGGVMQLEAEGEMVMAGVVIGI